MATKKKKMTLKQRRQSEAFLPVVKRKVKVLEHSVDLVEQDTTPIAEALAVLNSEALTLHGFEGALIGISERRGLPALAVYDRKKCIKILMDRDEMTEEAASQHFEFYVVGAQAGEITPIILDTMDF